MVQLMLTRVLVATLALALGAAISQSGSHCGGSITSSGAQQSPSKVCLLYSLPYGFMAPVGNMYLSVK